MAPKRKEPTTRRKRTKVGVATPTVNPNRGALTASEQGHFRIRYLGTMGERFDGRFNPLGALALECSKDDAHLIGPGEYYSVDAGGNAICRSDKPFELVAES